MAGHFQPNFFTKQDVLRLFDQCMLVHFIVNAQTHAPPQTQTLDPVIL